MLVYRKFKKALVEQESLVGFMITSRVPKDSEASILETNKLKALTHINSYVDSLDWVATQKTREKIQAVIDADFDYVLVSKQFGTSVSTLKVMFSRNDSVLKAKLSKPLDIIMSGDPSGGVDLFKLGDRELAVKNFRSKIPLLDLVTKSEPIEPSREYSTAELINALKFIKIYSKPQFELGITRAGVEPLNYLLYVLLNPTDQFGYQRQIIIQFLNNELKLDDLVQLLLEFEQARSYSEPDDINEVHD